MNNFASNVGFPGDPDFVPNTPKLFSRDALFTMIELVAGV